MIKQFLLLFVIFSLAFAQLSYNDDCLLCKIIITSAEAHLSPDLGEVEHFLAMCDLPLMANHKARCESFINNNYAALVSYINQKETPTFACEKLSACSSNNVRPLLKLNPVQPAEEQPVKGALECTICTTIINLAESILGSNASETAIENFLEHTVCGILPGSLKQDCDALVQAYLPALVQYIQEGEDGQVACTQLGLCNSTTVRPLLKLNPVQPAEEQQVRDALECTACTIIVTLAETFLGSNASESTIENFMENTVCSLVPSTYQTICDTIVQTYTPQLITYIQNQVSPTTACQQVGLCNSTVTYSLGRMFKN